MATYYFNEGTIDIPATWVDQSIHAFSSRPPGEDQPSVSLTLSKDRVSEAQTNIQYANRQFVEAAKRLPGFELVEQQQLELGGQATLAGLFRWIPGRTQALLQRQTYLRIGAEFLVVTLSYREADIDEAGRRWQVLLGSLSLRAAETRP